MERLNRVARAYDPTTFENVSVNNPFPVDYSGGVLWGGYYGSTTYRSFDYGKTWDLVNAPTDGGALRRVKVMRDGSVILMFSEKIYRSTDLINWEEKLASPLGGFIYWSMDSDGNKVIVAEYGLPHTDSQRLWISLDSGDTFNVYYKTDIFPTGDANTHFHGVAYDYSRDRFWFCVGDVTHEGHYYSDDNGVTWTAVPLGSSLAQPDAQCTSISACKTGMVMTTDTPTNSGVLCIPHTEDPANMKVQFAYKMTEENVMQGFGYKNEYHEQTGITFTTWRTDNVNRPPTITWTNGVEGGIFYEWTGEYVVSDSFRGIVALPNGKILTWLSLKDQGSFVLTFERFYIT